MPEGQSGEKTEQPTPKKIRDARKKGQVARSSEVVTTVSLMSVILYLYLLWQWNFDKMVIFFDQAAQIASVGNFEANVNNALILTGILCVLILIPILGVVIIAGITSNYFQFGAVFAFENLMPKGERISPAAGAKRIFSMKQLFETFKSIVKIAFLSTVLYLTLNQLIASYIYALSCGMGCLINVTSIALFNLFIYSGLAFMLIAAIDFIYQKHTHTKSLMMTKDEVKREYKETEGDPHFKGRRREFARELIEGGEDAAIANSNAVIVNPTHLAILLMYEEGKTPLPLIIGKARDLNAYRVRAKAERRGIPIFRNVTLARALYADVSVGGYVPPELFEVVAEVLAWIAKNKDLLYHGPLHHGVIDMESGDHKKEKQKKSDLSAQFSSQFDNLELK